MANANNGGNGEPYNAPQPGRWYNLKLGSSFKDDPSAKFCTLRYEFKPASIDKSQPASLNKNKDNRVTVEFSNNQPGKPKVTFEGSSEDYKENDGVLFFNGESFCLERLNRAVKRLRHVRMPGESAAIAAAVANASTPVNFSATAGTGVENRSSPLARIGKSQPVSNFVAHTVPVEVERIDIGEQEIPVVESPNRPGEHPTQVGSPSSYKNDEMEENFHLLFGKDDDDDDYWQNETNGSTATEIDVHLPIQHDSDEEISDVDVSDNEGDKGPNAAEALRAEVNAEEDRQQTSSYSGSSGSGSRSSGSASSSSGSEASDDDSVSSGGASSGGDVEI